MSPGVLQKQGGGLPAGSGAEFERSLKLLDQAISDSRAALEAGRGLARRAVEAARILDPERLSDVAEGLEKICLRAMAKDVKERYQTAAELIADLDQGFARFHAACGSAAEPAC